MFPKQALKTLASRLAGYRSAQTVRAVRLFRPWMERLEDRCLLSNGLALPSSYGQIPLSFEVNQGQTNAQVDYLAHGQGYGIFLSKTDAVLSLTNAKGGGNAIRMHLVGDNSAAEAIGLDQQSGISNYL